MSAAAHPWLESCRGCSNLELFPVAVWSRLVSRHARNASRDIVGHDDPMGYGPLREIVAEYLGGFRAVKCDPAQIMVTTGSQQALQIAALAVLDPKESAWLEEPGYPGTRRALQAAGAHLVPVPVDGEGLLVAHGIQRAPGARAAFVTPAHQFPMGVTLSAARRIELLSWARNGGAWIIEDDYDGEFRFCGSPVASLQGLDPDGRVVYVGALTRMMFPSLRLGFTVIPQDLMPAFLNIRNATDTLATPVLYQMAMTDFIREGHFFRHIKRMRQAYMSVRKSLAAAISAQLHGVLEVVGDEAGLHLVTLLPPGVDDVKIAARIPTTYALSQCCTSSPERGGLVIGYGNLSNEGIGAIVQALKSAIETNIIRH